jgi:hypothetical protein
VLVVVLDYGQSIAIVALDGTILARKYLMQVDLYGSSQGIETSDSVVSFLALGIDDLTFCLLTRRGKLHQFKYQMIES